MGTINRTKSGCTFAADIVPYMYGELAASESLVFESHLLECTTCTDEFAAVSSARYEVYDWKKIEFDPMATPFFEIPLDRAVQVSFIERLRAAVTIRWAVPTVAFACLAVIVGLTLMSSPTGEGGGEVANVDPVALPVPERETSIPPEVDTKNDDTAAVTEAEDRPEQRAVSATAERRPSIREGRRQLPRTTETRLTVTAASQTTSAPRLNQFAEEEEDTSLRLAELFDDIETSD